MKNTLEGIEYIKINGKIVFQLNHICILNGEETTMKTLDKNVVSLKKTTKEN